MNLKQWMGFLTLTLIWGASFLWIKIAVRETGPFTIVVIRLALAVVVMLPFLLKEKSGCPKTRRMWGVLLIQGLISTAVPWILITWAEKYIDSALATVLNGTVPMFTIVTAHLFLHDDKMTVRRVGGLLIGFLGVVVLVQKDLSAVLSGGGGVSLQLLGQLAMLGSSLCYAVANVYARAKLRHVTPVFQTFYTMLVADAVMWVVAPAVEAPFQLPSLPVTWIAIAWLGLLGAGLSYLLFYQLLHQIGPTRVATVTYTIPVVGVSLGVIVLGEELNWSLVVGTVLVVMGVWGATQRAKRQT